jgi:hypothetical protein
MLIEILSHTPLWVFGLFVFLIVLGLQQSRARIVKTQVIFLLPIGMLILSFVGLISSFGTNPRPILLWTLSLLLLGYLNFRFFPLRGAKHNKEDNKYHLQGSWTPLALMMAIFLTKYVVGVASALKPDLLITMQFIVLLSILYGIFSGVFIGRALSTWSLSRKQQVVT